MNRLRAAFAQADWLLLFAVSVLMALGLLAIFSISLSTQGSGVPLVSKQLIAFGIGLGCFLFVSVSNYRLLKSWSWFLYALAVVLLFGVLTFGVTIRGTTGWFAIGGFHIQPVEFAKLALAVVLAKYFGDRASKEAGWKEAVISGAITAAPVALTLAQPDLGSALVLIGTWGLLLLFGGLRKRSALLMFLLFAVAAGLAWQFFLADYQQARILSFVNPESDPLGQGYNVRQAIIGIGSGGWFGRGLGFGSQSQLKFIPESQTDFIFAVVAEELGFFGVLILLGAFFLLFQRILLHASRTRDDFTSYLLLGVGSSLFLQAAVNIGMNLGLLPVTGIALPLVSYGGSSLVLTLLMLGLVHSVAVRQRRGRTHRVTVGD